MAWLQHHHIQIKSRDHTINPIFPTVGSLILSLLGDAPNKTWSRDKYPRQIEREKRKALTMVLGLIVIA